MKKDFNKWNDKKKDLEYITESILFKTGEIWWCSIGLNIDTESCGKGDNYTRPVLVLKKLSSNSFIGIPVSTKKKVGTWFLNIDMYDRSRCFLLNQIRMFSTNRLQKRLININSNDFVYIKRKLKSLLELH